MRSELKIISESSPAGCNAFKLGSDIKLSLNVAGIECEKIWVFIGNDDKVVFSGEVGFYRVHDEFFAGITVNTQSLTGKAGLFFCHFEFLSPDGKRHYTAFDGDSVCYISDKFINELQFTVYDDIYKSPDWFAKQ